MFQRSFLILAGVGAIAVSVGAGPGHIYAQDAQAEATAKAARREAVQDSARSNIEVAKPTQVDTQSNSDSAPAPDAEKLKQRAGEQAGDNPSGRTLILGMRVKEAADGGVEVAEVGTATPAQEAGILKGDRIISFQNFKANTYRKWIDGITRIATKAEDGSKLTVVVSRDGNPVTTKVRVPENQLGPIKLPLGPQPGLVQPSPGNVNHISANGGDSNTAVVANGAVANFLNEATEPSAEKAVAELFRIGATRRAESDRNVSDRPHTEPGSPQSAGARVGFAGFRNNASGMLVMVDVGGLEPGNYTVNLAEASTIRNQPETSRQTSNFPEPANPATDEAAKPRGSDAEANPGGLVPNSNKAPLETPAGAPQSQLEQPAREIPHTVLAQVAASPGIEGTATPTSDSKLPESQIRATGANQPTSVAPPVQNSLGTLTVDQSGTGRMQQVAEGLRVNSVVGQALVIYISNSSATTLPANLDTTTDPSPLKKTAGADPANSSNARLSSAAFDNRAAPVVGGVIHLLSDRGAPAPDERTTVPSPKQRPQ